jgi:hypothetical protein
MSTEDPSAERAADELHSAIMNVPCKPYDGTTTYDAYCRGHRDARHAAAGLVVSARASSAAAVPAPAYARIADVGFRWVSDAMHHVPYLTIDFEPVPANVGNQGKGWRDRDAMVAWLAATPAPPQAAGQADMVLVERALIRRAQQAINWHLEPESPQEHEATMLELMAIGWPDAPPQAVPDTDAEHQSKGGAAMQALHSLGYTYEAGAWFPPAAPVAVDTAPELPPLPKPALRSSLTDALRRLHEIWSYTAEQMHEYGDARARAAIRAVGAGSRDKEDAERYRWLRNGCDEKHSRASHIAQHCYGMEWDAAIDAARGKA